MRASNVVVGAVLMAALGVTPALGGGKDEGGKKYKTPQEVFDAAKAAAKKGDWKAFTNSLTKKGVENMAAMGAMMGSMIKGFAGAPGAKLTDDQKTALKDLDKALQKHGLTEAYLKKIQPEKGAAPKKPEEVKAELLKPIKNRMTFIGDVMKAVSKFMPGGALLQGAELKDVTISGDTAKGTVVTKGRGGRDQREPIAFAKSGGSWKIEIPFEMGPSR